MADSLDYTETIAINHFYKLNQEDSESSDFELEFIYTKLPEFTYPFMKFNKLNDYYCIYAPFFNENNIKTYNFLKPTKYKKIGLSIYQEFPSAIKNKYENDFHKNNLISYTDNSFKWLHTFKNPENYEIPLEKQYFFNYSNLLINDSKNYHTKIFDLIIICDNYFNSDSTKWLKYYHNILLINKFIKFVNDNKKKIKIKIVIIDPKQILDKIKNNNLIYVYDENKINYYLDSSKVCIIFNKHASFIPYIGNALLRNNVLLMYHSILGEWNLINKYTGAFFSNLETLIQQIQETFQNYSKFKPRKWYTKRHNPVEKTNKLMSILR